MEMRNNTTERPAKIPIRTASIKNRWSSLKTETQRFRFAASFRVKFVHSECFGGAVVGGGAGFTSVIPLRLPASRDIFARSSVLRRLHPLARRIFALLLLRF